MILAYTGMVAATRDVSGTPLNDAAESSLSFYLEHNTAAYWGGERIQDTMSAGEMKDHLLLILI